MYLSKNLESFTKCRKVQNISAQTSCLINVPSHLVLSHLNLLHTSNPLILNTSLTQLKPITRGSVFKHLLASKSDPLSFCSDPQIHKHSRFIYLNLHCPPFQNFITKMCSSLQNVLKMNSSQQLTLPSFQNLSFQILQLLQTNQSICFQSYLPPLSTWKSQQEPPWMKLQKYLLTFLRSLMNHLHSLSSSWPLDSFHLHHQYHLSQSMRFDKVF